MQPNVSEVSLCYELNVDIQEGVICVWGKITRIITFVSYSLDFKVVSLVFMLAAAREMKFEMSSELKTETAQSCRKFKEM